MKIAQIASMAERVPPKKYGGTERVVFALTEELVRRGHDVTLFASGDSLTSAKLVSVFPRSLRESRIKDPYGLNPIHLLNIGTAYNRQDEFDIIHDHYQWISMPTANQSRTPVVMTLHGAFDLTNRQLFENLTSINYVAVSKAQTIPMPNINYAGIVYNGLKMDAYPFFSDNDGYLLFLGRLSHQKGIDYAIDAAQYLNIPLIIAGNIDIADRQFYKDNIEPRLSEQIRYIGEVSEEERNKLMSRALCLLHPVNWREPFGLTAIEAMACGAPVVAFKRGAIPEVIKNGNTGFVVEDVDEMIVAVQNIHQISREACRKHVLENFTVERMADGYEMIYRKILEEKTHKVLAKPRDKDTRRMKEEQTITDESFLHQPLILNRND